MTKQIHLIIPFSRPENKDKLIEAYRPMGVILIPIMFEDEVMEFDEAIINSMPDWVDNMYWIKPYIIQENSKDCKVMMPGTYKRNCFIKNCEIIDDDYYATVDDDDMYEPNVMDEIRKMDDDIVIIPMKRGHQTPKEAVAPRDYPTDTLWARPENVKLGFISAQQSFVKGKIFKQHLHNEESHCWDGELAVNYKESGEQIAYRPDLFALFNYYEPGRWDKGIKLCFGVMINDQLRFDQVLRRSSITGPLKYIQNPESATKGLNKLLDMAEDESADIAVLVHQDIYFRNGWIDQVRSQIKMLPASWVVAGVIGKDASGVICGKFHDMRIPDYFDTSDIHIFPHEACCFDEAVIIVNMKKKFRFDETLSGFDLYGTLAVLQTWETGGEAFVIDAFCEHYCTRPFTWFPPEEFRSNYKMLHNRFSDKWKLDSTALGLSPDAEERITQLKAFMTSAGPEQAVA